MFSTTFKKICCIFAENIIFEKPDVLMAGMFLIKT